MKKFSGRDLLLWLIIGLVLFFSVSSLSKYSSSGRPDEPQYIRVGFSRSPVISKKQSDICDAARRANFILSSEIIAASAAICELQSSIVVSKVLLSLYADLISVFLCFSI
jgi:predicted DNA repair protein MutK